MKAADFLRHAVLLCLSLLILLPLFAVVMGGFKSLDELAVNPVGLAEAWRTDAYMRVLNEPRFWTYLGNSAIITLSTVAITIALASLAAFAITFLSPRFGQTVLKLLALGLMVPPATAILPIFLQVRDLGLLDTHLGLILPQVSFGLAMATILLAQFFAEIPEELHQAAMIDGCSPVRFFVSIILPLATPIIATVATIQFVQSWNSYVLPLVLTASEARYTWPLGIMSFQGEYIQEWNVVLAFVALTLVPSVAFFLSCQRYIVAGLASGAVKG
jgi:raffinose/stachyose/melibiose transport system permease protein